MDKQEIKFLWKVIRNGLVLAGLYFFSIWASNEELNFKICKPIIIFLGTYIFSELTKRYGIETQQVRKKTLNTLIF